MKRGWSEIAAWSLSIARKEDPNNKELNLRLVEVLRERGQHDEAANVLMHLQKLFPQDGEIRKLMTSVQFTATIERGKYEDAGSTRDVMVNKAQLNKAEAAAPGQSPEADLKHAIRKDPANKENYLKLADFYRRQRNPRAAAEQLEKALEVSGGDPGVRELLEDVQLELMQVNLDAAKQIAAASAADQDRQQAVALSQELLKREIEVLSARVERYPADLGRKFELAQRFMRVQKWTLAIPLLQKASSDPRLRTRALVSLAKSFVADRKTSLARGQLERAIPDINLDHERGLYLEASYLLGRVCEELGDRAAAENAYQQVIVYEYDYKDAEKRLSALQQKQPSPDANKPGAGG
jgi:tetratricopeptide (TPR) repeat protein